MRVCIFCGSRPLTNEDAWPKWLMKILIPNSKGIAFLQHGDESIKTWKPAPAELKLKIVCANCNNGWMSKLESKVKPIVESLLARKVVTLNSEERAILGHWSVKNAIVLQALRKNSASFYSLEERLAFKESFKLPELTMVWIAQWRDNQVVDSRATLLESNNIGEGCVTTVGFGELAVQVLSLRKENKSKSHLDVQLQPRYGSWQHLVLQIIPNQNGVVMWPPLYALSGKSGLSFLHDRW